MHSRFVLGGVALTAALLIAGFFMPKWLTFLVTMAAARGLVSLGIVLMMRGGVVSFGQGLVFAAGAYAAALAFSLGGSAASRIQHIGQLQSLVFLPLAILMLSRALERSSWMAGAAAGLFASFIVLGRDQVAKTLEGHLRRGPHEPCEPLPEGQHQLTLVHRQPGGRLVAFERREDRPPRRGPAHPQEAVVGEADERRREHGQQVDVVVAVAHEPQVGEHV